MEFKKPIGSLVKIVTTVSYSRLQWGMPGASLDEIFFLESKHFKTNQASFDSKFNEKLKRDKMGTKIKTRDNNAQNRVNQI